VNAAGVAFGALSVAAGSYGLYQSALKQKDEKTTAADVAAAAMAGAGITGGTAMIVNAIPIGGQIAYGAAVLAGAVGGTASGITRMVKEMDCDRDPVTGQWACCNLANSNRPLSNARYVRIGDEMFCSDFPRVKACVKGKEESRVDYGGIRGLFSDDHWSKNCEVKFCSGYQTPIGGDYQIQRYGSSDSEGKVCWKWECVPPMIRQGGRCIQPQQESEVEQAAQIVAIDQPEAVEQATRSVKKGGGRTLAFQQGDAAHRDDFGCCMANNSGSGDFYINSAGTRMPIYPGDIIYAQNAFTNCRPRTDDFCFGEPAQIQNLPEQPAQIQPPAPAGPSMEELARLAEMRRQEQIRQDQINAIKSKMARIGEIEKNFDLNGWTGKDGGFNWLRLGLDAAGGAIVGTGAGILTNVLIKNSQLKSGYESVQCMSATGTTAEYGETFIVR
jgi:hypothetical protein